MDVMAELISTQGVAVGVMIILMFFIYKISLYAKDYMDKLISVLAETTTLNKELSENNEKQTQIIERLMDDMEKKLDEIKKIVERKEV